MLAHGYCRCQGALVQRPARRIIYRRHPESSPPAAASPVAGACSAGRFGCGSIADRAIPGPRVATLERVRA